MVAAELLAWSALAGVTGLLGTVLWMHATGRESDPQGVPRVSLIVEWRDRGAR